jgi:hypothetical protein
MAMRGHDLLAILLTPPAIGLLWYLRHDSAVGATLTWCQGRWILQDDSKQRYIALTRRSVATPWVIFLAFSELPEGPGGQLWLYADSIPDDQRRRLRVRLNLMQ